MAVMSDADRQNATDKFMRQCGTDKLYLAGIMKADCRAMVNYLDDYFNTNAAAINTGSPATFRTNGTTPQKALAMAAVITERYIKGT